MSHAEGHRTERVTRPPLFLHRILAVFPVVVCNTSLPLRNLTASFEARVSPDHELATHAMHNSADAACQGTQPFCLPSQNLVGLAAGAEASLGPGPVLDGQQDAPRWTTRETEEQDRFAVYQMKVVQLAPHGCWPGQTRLGGADHIHVIGSPAELNNADF